ncbi:MAG: hypothetical protein KGQ60_00490 [Planctomycetes bacterium]|nr:hypothetical protein [Planctomycetota bacterium]
MKQIPQCPACGTPLPDRAEKSRIPNAFGADNGSDFPGPVGISCPVCHARLLETHMRDSATTSQPLENPSEYLEFAQDLPANEGIPEGSVEAFPIGESTEQTDEASDLAMARETIDYYYPSHLSANAGGSRPLDTAVTDDGETRKKLSEIPLELSGPWVMQRRRPSKHEGVSWIRRIIPPVLGGLAAFPLATAILWYGFGKDIGSTGPTVAKYVPWIVPRHLRGSRFGVDGRLYPESSSPKIGRSDRAPGRSSAARETEAIGKSLPNAELDGTGSLSPSSGDRSRSSSEPREVTSPADASATEPSPVERPSSETKIEVEQSPEAEMNPTRLLRATFNEISAIQENMEKDWSALPREQQLNLAKDFFESCVKLSKQTSESRGNSLQAWQRELDRFAVQMLSKPAYEKLLTLANRGSFDNITMPQEDEFVVTIQELNIVQESSELQAFPIPLLSESHATEAFIPPQLLKKLPLGLRKYILLGRLEASAQVGELKLAVHTVLTVK